MTALLYLLEPERVCVATDSLVLDFEKKPLKYATKSFVFPHLKGLICGTGALDLLLHWVCYIENRAIINNIEILDKITPDILKSFYSDMRLPNNISSTIYHFGLDIEGNNYIGYAYRSNNNFVSEKLIYSLGVKPPYGDLGETGLDYVYKHGIPESFNHIMEIQKQYDEELAPEYRLGIGGEVHFIMLTKENIITKISHTFDDYKKNNEKFLKRDGTRLID